MKMSSPVPMNPDLAAQALDDLLDHAELVRNPRADAAGEPRRSRRDGQCVERAAPEGVLVPASTPRVAANGVVWLPVAAWKKSESWLWHGFSTRKGGLSRAYCSDGAPGELNLGFTASDEREIVLRNRALFAEAVTGEASTSLISLRQIHSSVIVVGHDEETRREKPHDRSSSLGCKGGVPGDSSRSLGCKGDGLMTDKPGVLLGIQTADCIPVLVADRKRRVVAAFHAGWRGTVKRIVEAGIGRMRLEYGSQPEDLIAAIGPGIGACCYAVGEEVQSSFESQFAYARDLFREVDSQDAVRSSSPMLFLSQRAPGDSSNDPGLHLNLVEANRRQLLDAGVKPGAIQLTGGCTSCQPELFFSHRASQGYAGRMLSVIGICPR